MKLRKEPVKFDGANQQKEPWAKKKGKLSEDLAVNATSFGNTNRVISQALKKNCVNLQGMKIQEMVKK